jgi:hypothetical protein
MWVCNSPPSPLSLLSRLTDRPFPHTKKSESNSISAILNEPRTSLKRKEHPSTSDERMTCSTTGPKTSRRLSKDMTFAPAGPSFRLQSLRISSQADASTLMPFSHITTPPSPPTNTQRKLESLSSPLRPLTLLEQLNPPLTGSPHREELSGLTDLSSHSGLMSSDSTESSSCRCSPNTSLSVTSALFNPTKQSGNKSGVVVPSSSPISLTSRISRCLTFSPLAPSTTLGHLPILTLEDAPETRGHARSA